ncbi:transglutaminase domain-containing protein [Paenibacillus radicis (ex Gao et al. 2016)]|uniref:Peptidase n=1 Tax=Paenibacillus radicis (ex Gao et al. 2016) TaxID=1737354 RepID=A0A917LWX6_9BACL|nr:transglutaminase domain-containing protein [Paenibacillus radicis (ex Gao et al. 2016)]GGG63102.1 peptidase [Paenibacillus radicis (ex Gao et al. 2016)]
MRKHGGKLLALTLVVIIAFSLEKKLDLFSVMADAGQSSTMGQLESAMAKQFQSRAEHFTLQYAGDKKQLSDTLQTTIRSSLAEDDYVAYILDSYLYTIRSWGDRSTIKIEARYRETPEQTAQVDETVKHALAELLTPSMNDHQKVKVIHDWIVTRLDYDQSLTRYTAYEALATGKAVCQGYSLLGYKMLKEAGIPVLIAEGTVKTGDHAWNMVQLDGQWYHLDLTWDDPVVQGAEQTGSASSRMQPIRYTYYLKTDKEMKADHDWVKSYPPATASYGDKLRELGDGSRPDAKAYIQLKEDIGLGWLEAERTIADRKALSQTVLKQLAAKSVKFQFRYLPGERLSEDLKAAFLAASIPVGYSASYEPYGNDGSMLVSVEVSYSS